MKKQNYENKLLKDVPENKQIEIKTHLTPELYWKFRTVTTELWLAEQKAKNASYLAQLAQNEIQMKQLELKLYQMQHLKGANDALAIARKELENTRTELEEYLGQSLVGKVISDETLEVKDAPQP